MLAWADTQPGYTGVAVVRRQVGYEYRGTQRSSTLLLRVLNSVGRTEWWDAALSRGSSEAAACDAKRRLVEAGGDLYVPWGWDYFASRQRECLARSQMQNLLYAGAGCDTSQLEQDIFDALGVEPRAVASLAAHLRVEESKALLAAVRLWRRGVADLPLTATAVNPLMRIAKRRSA